MIAHIVHILLALKALSVSQVGGTARKIIFEKLRWEAQSY